LPCRVKLKFAQPQKGQNPETVSEFPFGYVNPTTLFRRANPTTLANPSTLAGFHSATNNLSV
jgi:hypothetical protein